MLRYLVGVVLPMAALGVTMLAQSHLQRSIFVLFFAAVTVTAWIGGLLPALLATLLSIVSVDYFFMVGLSPDPLNNAVAFTVFGLVSALIAWLSGAARESGRRARTKAEELERQSETLTAQMEESRALQESLERLNVELAAANERIERDRGFLEQAQSSARLGSWEWDIASNQVTWSAEMFRVYGREPGSVEVSFETFLDLVHPEDREMVRLSVERAFQTGEPFDFDHRAVLPDGIVRWLHSRGRVIKDAAGQPVRMVGSGQDVTERRRAAESQQLLAEASEALASSLDYPTTLGTVAQLAVRGLADWCSVAIGDVSGRYENIAVAHRDPERVKWATEYNRLHPPQIDAPTGVPNVLRTGRSEFYPEIPREMLVASAKSDEELRVLDELQMRSAMIVPMLVRGRAIGAISFIAAESAHRFTSDDLRLAEGLAGRAAIAIENARLFEETRVARAEAEAANRTKMGFLAAMSHELRTPLNAIGGYSELMELEIQGPVTDAQRDSLARIRRAQQRLLALVEEVLAYAKEEAGQVSIEIGNVPVDDLMKRMGELIAPEIATRRLSYEYAGSDPALAVRADPQRLEQIILNLLTNAMKFTHEGGRLAVTVASDGQKVAISVTDTGIGIAPEKLGVVFDPFVQLPQGPEIRGGGVGLGLAISRDLARAMHGELRVQSVVGKGSTFTVDLPLASVVP